MFQQDDRTEKATPRRLEKAREEGRVVSSRYFLTAIQFAAAWYLVSSFSGDSLEGIHYFKKLLRSVFEASDDNSGEWLKRFSLPELTWRIAAAGCMVPLAGLVAQLACTQGYFGMKNFGAGLKGFNPVSKLGNSLKEGLRSLRYSILTVVVFGGLCYVLCSRVMADSGFAMRLAVPQQILLFWGLMGSWIRVVFWFVLLVGVFDLISTIRKFQNELKMTKQEIKDEYKESNGNPEIKGRMRRIMRELAGKRMMQKVPKASVVITNPTHYAIAIEYHPDSMAVPVVLAKGVDFMALRIRKIAMENEIPIVENPPLAQALYKAVEPGQEIPLHLYRAVAEVLAYVYRILDRNVHRGMGAR